MRVASFLGHSPFRIVSVRTSVAESDPSTCATVSAFSRVPQTGAGRRGGSCRPGSWLLRGSVVLVHVLPPRMLARLPGQGVKLFPRPRAVVVFVRLEPLVFVKAGQDQRPP